MSEYDEYESNCKIIRDYNKGLLVEFEAWLNSASLSKKAVRDHRSNIDFYINEYLLSDDAIEANNGIHDVSMFLGYWFIRKALWANQSSIKANAASLKKFYTFMFEQGFVDQEALRELFETIKEDMPEWLATLRRYDDGLAMDDF